MPDRKKSGLRDKFTHSIDGVSPVFATDDGGALLCFVVNVDDDVTSANGSPVVQAADRSSWGNWLAPGSYSTINLDADTEACIAKVPESGIFQAASAGGDYNSTATPT
jgi:hypothetical protein